MVKINENHLMLKDESLNREKKKIVISVSNSIARLLYFPFQLDRVDRSNEFIFY